MRLLLLHLTPQQKRTWRKGSGYFDCADKYGKSYRIASANMTGDYWRVFKDSTQSLRSTYAYGYMLYIQGTGYGSVIPIADQVLAIKLQLEAGIQIHWGCSQQIPYERIYPTKG